MVTRFSIRDATPEATYTADTITVISDVPAHLWMRWTHVPPRMHRKPRLRRGMWLNDDIRFCFDVYTDLEQDEPGDTTSHTFTFSPCTNCFTFWYYLWGLIEGVVSPSTSTIFQYPDQGDCPTPPLGTITGTIDTLHFDLDTAAVPKICHVSGPTYAIAYQGGGNDGWLTTIQILDDGTITGILNTFEFDPASGRMPSITHVDGDVYAIAYSTLGGQGKLITLEIDPGGIIGPIIRSYIFEPGGTSNYPHICHVSGTTYTIWYTGPGTTGWLTTINITAGGIIGPLLGWSQFDPAYANYVSPLHITGNVWACAYQAVSFAGPGRLATLTISPAGIISPIIQSQDFDPSYTRYPVLFHVSGSVHGIAYRDGYYDGWLTTITITPAGAIGPVIDTLEYEPVMGDFPAVANVSPDIWTIAYQGPDYDAWIKTIAIAPTGIITGQIDQYEYDPDFDRAQSIIHVHGNTYAIAYQGPGYDGWLKTIGIISP